MKKILVLLLALTMVFCCVGAQAETAAETGFTVTMTANPTTGYDWAYVADDELVTVEQEILTSADVDKLAGIEGSEELVAGEGCIYIYTIKGVKAGEAVVAFEYSQSWDENSTVAGVTYTLRVNEDLSVECVASTVGV